MGEVVDDPDAIDDGAHRLPARDALEGGQARRDRLDRETLMVQERDHRGGVLDVRAAGQRHLKSPEANAPVLHRRSGPPPVRLRSRWPSSPPLRGRSRSRPGLGSSDAVHDALGALAREDEPILGHEVVELVELRLDLLDAVVDVRVIELERRHDERARLVVHELRHLVEVGGVVLVAFDDEVRPLPSAKLRSKLAGTPRPGSSGPGPRGSAPRRRGWWWWSCRACPR